jgi:uncharacterized protein YdaU (DUF1376 family)
VNYYKRHLGDYARKTRHLSIVEHGIYTLLLDAYYDRERSISEAEAIRFSGARTEEELRAVKNVLSEFFSECEGLFSQSHADEIISEFHKRQKTNRKLGAIGGKRNAKRIESESLSETEANDKPSHKPLTKEKKKKRASDDVTFREWIATIPEGADAIPTDHPVYAFAERAGIPEDFVILAWRRFERDYRDKPKRYKDWPAAFRNAVEKGWGDLWRIGRDGQYYLTTAGEQLRRAIEAAP